VRVDRTADDLAAALPALIQGAFVVAVSTRDEQALRRIAPTMAMPITPPAQASAAGSG